jgi:signal transduction histidine kinase
VKPRTASRLAWTLFALSTVVFAIASWLTIAAHDASAVLPFLPALLAFSGVGALVASRRPDNPLGWLMLAMAALSLGLLSNAYARYGLTRAPHAVGTAWAAWLFVVSVEVSTVPLTFILLLFPHGHVVSPRWRVVAWAAVGLPLAAGVCTAIADVNFSVPTNFPTLRDPVHLLPRSTVSPVYSGAQILNLMVILVAAVSLVLRFRRAGGEEREQLKWIAFAGALTAVGFIVLAVIPNGPEPVLAFIVLVPLIAVAAGVAVLRYRLYDIDVVINKTLVYGSLAGFITAVYVAIVVGIGSLVGQGDHQNLALSIVATAVVATGFQPVRDRVQRLANRLVYGKRATPYEVLSEFSARMGSTQASEDLLPRMARILAEGTGGSEAIVWLRVGNELVPEASWPTESTWARPQPVPTGDEGFSPVEATATYPVHYRDELLGALSLTKPPGERLTPAEDKLAADLASQAGLVLRNVGLTGELLQRLDQLRASRQRLVRAQDEERRRLERNIHDGAQQQLVALAMKLGLLGRFIDKNPGEAKTLADQLQEEARQATCGTWPGASIRRSCPIRASDQPSSRRHARPPCRSSSRSMGSGGTRKRRRQPCTSALWRPSRTSRSTPQPPGRR